MVTVTGFTVMDGGEAGEAVPAGTGGFTAPKPAQ